MDVTFSTTGKAGTVADPRCVAEVTQNVSSGTPVLQACNWDSDHDGRLDRVSFALNSAYREECVSQQDGVAWSPAFNISSENETLVRATPCMNDLPGMSADTAPLPITQFCDSGAEDDLRADIERIVAVAQEVQPAAFKNSTGTLTNNSGWWGGAKCHMGQGVTFDGASHDTVTPHSGNLAGLNGDDEDHLGRADYWIEDTCPKPVVVRLKENSNVDVGMVCGCGVLIIPDNTLTLKTSSHLLWRGLVIWDMKAAGKELRIDGNGASTFVVDGGMLMTGTEALQVNITKKVDDDDEVENDVDGTVKQLYRFNQAAVNDAFKAVPLPVPAIRRLR